MLTNLNTLLNDEEVKQFYDALESHIQENENLHQGIIQLISTVNDIMRSIQVISNNQRVIVNLMSGYGEYGTRQPLVEELESE